MSIIKLKENRVWRTYTGGLKLNELLNRDEGDSQAPENWIASVTEANNPTPVVGEGLSVVDPSNEKLIDLISADPKGYLGEKHFKKYGKSTGVLVKLLDAAERLTIQVHPNKEKALSLFNSFYGKTEAWYILEGREIDGEPPHIYFGFKKGITRKIWMSLFEQQDVSGMLNCMHKIYVKPGEVYLIEGGNPHAIGAGCFILEVQEPTDYTIRIEKVTPKGYVIPDNICHQGLGFDKMFDCFEYVGYTSSEILDKWQLAGHESDVDTLISYEDTSCFKMDQLTVESNTLVATKDQFEIWVVISGVARVSDDVSAYDISPGSQLFITPETSCQVKNLRANALKIIRCFPPLV